MNVLLLEHPRGKSVNHFNDVANTPLSSCLMSGYIASLLQRNDIATEICDAYLLRYSFQKMVQEVSQKKFDILGVHLSYSWENTPLVMRAIDEIKSATDAPIVVYGFYPSFAYEHILRSHHSVEYVIKGEPEITFLELCTTLRSSIKKAATDGLAARKGENLIIGRVRDPIINLDESPFPLRTHEQLRCIGGNILGSRGCYGKCTFCYINNIYGTGCGWRGRTPENIVEEIQSILPSLSQKYIYFVDANFFGPHPEGQERAEKTGSLLKDLGNLSFGLECRVNDLKEKSLKKLVDAGLKDVFLGIESGSNRSLKRMRKGTTVEQNAHAIYLLRYFAIEPSIGFIMFEPDSQLQDIRDNFTFLKSHNLLNILSSTVNILYHPQMVFAGTDCYKTLEQGERLFFPFNDKYQGVFEFKDTRITFLADIVSFICRYLLAIMDERDSPLFWRKTISETVSGINALDARLNQWLVEYFESLLTRLEYGEIDVTTDTRTWYKDHAASLIDKIISESAGNEKVSCSHPHYRC